MAPAVAWLNNPVPEQHTAAMEALHPSTAVVLDGTPLSHDSAITVVTVTGARHMEAVPPMAAGVAASVNASVDAQPSDKVYVILALPTVL